MPFDFSFTDEQKEFRRSTRKFLESEILPSVSDYDLKEEFPTENIDKISKRGYMGLHVPKEYGGLGMGEIEYGILLEELGRICSGHGTILGAHLGLCLTPLLLFGSDEQKRRFIPKLATGEMLGAFSLTESSAGSDAANIQTTAEKDGNDFILKGSKIFCTNGDRSDVIIVFASNNRSLGPMGGITAFIVEKGFSGFSVGKVERKMGIRASTTAELVFDNCRVPQENVLGEFGAGFIVALTTLDGGRVGLAAGALGAAERALEISLDYVRIDKENGGSLAERQLIQWKLADSAMELHAARLMVYYSLNNIEEYFKIRAKREKVPRGFREKVSRESAISKAYVSEVASRAIVRAVEIQGTIGIEEGHESERGFRDSFISEIYEGTNEIQRMVIARDLLGLA